MVCRIRILVMLTLGAIGGWGCGAADRGPPLPSGAELELRNTEIRLYHRGQPVLNARAERLQSDDLPRLWLAEGIRATLYQNEAP